MLVLHLFASRELIALCS